jgi:ATP-dependent RNA/DNA helicase IGHMBP2
MPSSARGSTPAEAHFQRLIRLLALEAEAEKQEALQDIRQRSPQEAEALGNSLVNLVIRENEVGLGGRSILTFGKRNQNSVLPWTRLGVGSPVILSQEGTNHTGSDGSEGWRGVVSQVHKDAIQVAFSQEPEADEDAKSFRLDRSSDEVSRQRQRQALEKAHAAAANTRLAAVRDILLGLDRPLFCPDEIAEVQILDPSLNPPQREAVCFALSAADLAILHGPPGTGKTTTLVELIRQIVRQGGTVLACAPSNLAVDNLLERLLASGEHAIRLGHPARVLPELREHTLDLLVEDHPEMRVAKRLRREAYALRDKAAKFTRARPEPGMRHALRDEAKAMLAEARQIEDLVVERLLDEAPIVCATTTGLDPELLGRRTFDWCVMDEAGQSTEPGAWIPILRSERLVLAGDPFQLPPTVVSPEAAAEGFNVSLLERLMNQFGAEVSQRLVVQYRMHADIMQFSSQEFYESSLEADPSVGQALLQELPGVTANELTGRPVDFIDTAGASYDEIVDPDGKSRQNPLEAELVIHKVQALLDAGLHADQIAVIAPYSAQVRLLRERRESLRLPEIEIDTVDGFQGREKEAVVVSLVRSNPEGEIGFLADVRRMNVALTRARRKLIVIGDSATVASHPFYRRLITYFESINAYHSVWEEN